MSKKKSAEENITAEETVEEKEQEETTPEEESKEPQEDWQDRYLRLFAEFDNYKKRTQKEALASYGNGTSDTLEKLLPIMDNFDRAIDALEEDNAFSQGVKMIYKQFKEFFAAMGVTEIPALGEKFDTNFHNAVMHIDDEAFGENEIAEVFMKGYKYKDTKVLRHSMVKVAN
jgi:molecular chaperone GrpE